jgi:hypothetical protein
MPLSQILNDQLTPGSTSTSSDFAIRKTQRWEAIEDGAGKQAKSPAWPGQNRSHTRPLVRHGNRLKSLVVERCVILDNKLLFLFPDRTVFYSNDNPPLTSLRGSAMAPSLLWKHPYEVRPKSVNSSQRSQKVARSITSAC